MGIHSVRYFLLTIYVVADVDTVLKTNLNRLLKQCYPLHGINRVTNIEERLEKKNYFFKTHNQNKPKKKFYFPNTSIFSSQKYACLMSYKDLRIMLSSKIFSLGFHVFVEDNEKECLPAQY